MSVFNLLFKVSSSKLPEQGHADCFRRFAKREHASYNCTTKIVARSKTIGRHASTRDFHLLSFFFFFFIASSSSFSVITKPRVPPQPTLSSFSFLTSYLSLLKITIGVAQSSSYSCRSQITIIRVEVEIFANFQSLTYRRRNNFVNICKIPSKFSFIDCDCKEVRFDYLIIE